VSQIQLGIDEIDRKYDVLEKMGEGGMGAIYKVRHQLLEEVRVIKTIRAHLKGHEHHQERFLREARMATQLRHPGIAQTHDFGIGDDGSAYIVMEFIDGTDLANFLDVNSRLPQDQVLELANQTLAILTYLHDKKLVHRDISPDNIMLTRDERGRLQVKLIDLGIAKQLETSQQFTQTGMFLGKLKYASPEQLGAAEGKTVAPASDLYSFGIVLYELLTGQFPINGESEAAILAGHLLHPPKSFEVSDPEATVSEPLREAVMRALEKLPEHRYASAEEFRQTLVAAAGGLRPDVAAPREQPRQSALGEGPPTVQDTAPRPRSAVAKTVLSTLPGDRTLRPALMTRKSWIGLALALVVAAAGFGVGRSGLAGRLLGEAEPARAESRQGPLPGAPDGPRPDGPPPGDARAGPPTTLTELDFGSYHALVIGNNQYHQLPQLETAVLDAEEIAQLLETKYGFRVRLVTDATRHEMITALTEVTESLSGRDNLLLYYAGHGWLDDKSQSGYWQPVDAEPFNTANWISTRHEISAVLNRSPAKQILVVADSCYAGALSEIIEPPAGPPPIGPDHVAYVRDLLSRRSRLALTSGGLSPVLDQGDGRHSVFSKALLEVLDGNSRIAEVSRMFGLIQTRVVAEAARFGVDQGPQLAPISQAGDQGGDFFFVPTRPAA
jgi:serine/threonine protein kinase